MDREEIISMALESGFQGMAVVMHAEPLERFFALAFETGAAAERNKLADWMMQYGFATVHGSTMEQLCDALGTEIVDRIEMEVDAEREECAKVCEDAIDGMGSFKWMAHHCAATIRARSNK